jgi:multicomponent Na+:H+ antiporter subunit G
MTALGNAIIWLGAVFILIGIIGIFRFDNFYARIMVSSKIDTVGMITIIIGLIIRHGLSFFSLKLVLLIIILIIINPLAAHFTARCAHLSGYEPGDE